jgi:Cu2+-exporting ATPase
VRSHESEKHTLAEAKDFEAITGKGVTGTVEIRKLHWEIKNQWRKLPVSDDIESKIIAEQN